jgi:hypothetical protein
MPFRMRPLNAMLGFVRTYDGICGVAHLGMLRNSSS